MLFCCCFCAIRTTAQGKLTVAGATIVIDNGAALVIDNPDPSAIARTGNGYIKSEGPNNRITWAIAAGNNNAYTIPFGNAAGYFPLSFTASAGTGTNGQLVFSTYPTGNWKNSDYLPPGVTKVNGTGTDNSAKLIDRYWQLAPQGYTLPPTLTNLVFTYTDADFAAPNTITEANLVAQRWNTGLQSWTDFSPPSIVNTGANTVTVSSIPGGQLYNWWTLADLNSALPVTLLHFNADVINAQVACSWKTASEQNSDRFEVWKSIDAVHFDYCGSVMAAGNSNTPRSYSFTDQQPYAGVSFYKLKTVDRDGSFGWSAVLKVSINNTSAVFLYPNPATTYIIISSNLSIINSKPLAQLYDASGHRLQSFRIASTSQLLNTTPLPAGSYHIIINTNNQLYSLHFIKQ